jgi:1,4-dihydroxy-2-naphthoate octaprenyltransferase
MNKTKAWIHAARLRTLPLSVSGVVVGSFMALSNRVFDWKILVLALFTTLFLQVLSNLANDYGDSKNGKDTKDRQGPVRMVQSGIISLAEMKKMIFVFCILSLLSGILLIKTAHINFTSISFFILLALGILAIVAALTYTIGKNPYGYSGWGDVSVFMFFGLFSVIGTYFLYAGSISLHTYFPAIAVGALSVGVLNINNLRDYNTDKQTGKITMVVKLGIPKAKIYHIILIIIALVFSIFYMIINKTQPLSYLYLVVTIPLIIHILKIIKASNADMFDNELKKLALTTLAFSIVFGICIII